MTSVGSPRPPWRSLILVVGTLTAGLAIRTLPLGLPSAIVKHGGSVLWATMIYGIVSTARPRWPRDRAALAAVVVTTGIELSQLYYSPALDAFRGTRMGALLLGRVFALGDVLTYALAIGMAMAVDRYHANRTPIRRMICDGRGKWRARNDSNVRPSDS